ncbi:transcriptional regulator, partial [Streptomyces sp. SID8455]|nr:transcriptional regulator [Streptomyces sp. SID8455]
LLDRETLELPSDAQQLVVLLPADRETVRAVDRLGDRTPGRLRAV